MRKYKKNSNSEPAYEACAKEGCDVADELYPAPCSPQELARRKYFCFKHIREYNSAWDYYKNKSKAEIERDIIRQITGSNDTIPFSWFFGDSNFEPKNCQRTNGAATESDAIQPSSSAEKQAFSLLELPVPCSKTQLRENYKKIVMKIHPDRNMHKSKYMRKNHESLLKEINQSYGLLQTKF